MADVSDYDSDVICITETWLSVGFIPCLYTIDGYKTFTNYCKAMTGGRSMLYIKEALPCRVISSDVTSNDAHNICCAIVGNGYGCVLIASVYRALWASTSDTKDLFKHLG